MAVDLYAGNEIGFGGMPHWWRAAAGRRRSPCTRRRYRL